MFSAMVITLAGLAKIELPARTLYLCDGGMVQWGSETYHGDDSEFGVIAAIDGLRDATSDQAPGGRLTFLPASAAAAATLSSPGYQNSRIRFYLAEVDQATGQVIGTPDLVFDGLLDATVLRIADRRRELDMDFIARAERLFSQNEGNMLTSRFHESIWPGEFGFANATDAQISVAWGIEAPPRGAAPVTDFSRWGTYDAGLVVARG